MYEGETSLFDIEDPLVIKWTTKWWNMIAARGKLDLTTYDKDSRMVDIDTIKHNDAREVGSEWKCYNTWQQLGIDELLRARVLANKRYSWLKPKR